MSQVFAVIMLVGTGLYGLSTLFSSTPPLSSTSTTTAQGSSIMTQNAYSLNNPTKYGGKSKRQKHKGRLTKRKKH
jgi:hypothetical protein